MDGFEASAIKIISRAIELDKENRLQPASICYQEGIDLLLGVLKSCTDQAKKKRFREKLSEYMTRAEQIKDTLKLQKENGKYHEQVHIQINNFLQLCELLVIQCNNLTSIYLTTSHDPGQQQQVENLHHVSKSLEKRNISLKITFSDSLHDREIRLSNGWIIKIGRGLDYFKRIDKLSLGMHNLNLRFCHSTTVDIFHSKYVKRCSET